MSGVPRAYEGRCHCGAIGFVFHTAIPPKDWAIRACQCTFCRAHSALSASDPAGSLEFDEHMPGSLHRYQFGRKSADFLLCRHCGVYIGAMMDSGSTRFGIINVRVLLSLELPAPQPMNYENEGSGDRIARREKRWTPIADGA
jgi:hypothetical protein